MRHPPCSQETDGQNIPWLLKSYWTEVSRRSARKWRSQVPCLRFISLGKHLKVRDHHQFSSHGTGINKGRNKDKEIKKKCALFLPMFPNLWNNIDNRGTDTLKTNKTKNKKTNISYCLLAKEAVGLNEVLATTSCNNHFHFYLEKIAWYINFRNSQGLQYSNYRSQSIIF